MSSDPQSRRVLVTLTPPNTPRDQKRAPLDICCVIDVSGSMGSDAPVPGEAGAAESTGLSVLDVVKHALRTIIATMQDGIFLDSYSAISY